MQSLVGTSGGFANNSSDAGPSDGVSQNSICLAKPIFACPLCLALDDEYSGVNEIVISFQEFAEPTWISIWVNEFSALVPRHCAVALVNCNDLVLESLGPRE